MTKVEVYIDSNFSDIFTFTAIGHTGMRVNAANGAFDLSKGTVLTVDAQGKVNQLDVMQND